MTWKEFSTAIISLCTGNDDAIRSINLYINLFAETILDAKKNIQTKTDIGEALNPPKESNLNKKTENKKNLKNSKNNSKKVSKVKK